MIIMLPNQERQNYYLKLKSFPLIFGNVLVEVEKFPKFLKIMVIM
nr:MAG TPA: hypothetical protein [Caudoviricetes sp.]